MLSVVFLLRDIERVFKKYLCVLNASGAQGQSQLLPRQTDHRPERRPSPLPLVRYPCLRRTTSPGQRSTNTHAHAPLLLLLTTRNDSLRPADAPTTPSPFTCPPAPQTHPHQSLVIEALRFTSYSNRLPYDHSRPWPRSAPFPWCARATNDPSFTST